MPEAGKPVVFLKGRKVILRPMCKSTDLEACLRWINDPEIRQYLLAFLPITEKQEEEWFDNLGKSSSDIVFAIETIEGGNFIGTMSLNRISSKDGTAVTGALIGEKEYRGQGFGTDAKMTLLDYAFNTLNLRKVCSSVKAFNGRSLRYNLKCGYREEGRRVKQFFVDGEYHDEILLAVFRENWLPLWEVYQRAGGAK